MQNKPIGTLGALFFGVIVAFIAWTFYSTNNASMALVEKITPDSAALLESQKIQASSNLNMVIALLGILIVAGLLLFTINRLSAVFIAKNQADAANIQRMNNELEASRRQMLEDGEREQKQPVRQRQRQGQHINID